MRLIISNTNKHLPQGDYIIKLVSINDSLIVVDIIDEYTFSDGTPIEIYENMEGTYVESIE